MCVLFVFCAPKILPTRVANFLFFCGGGMNKLLCPVVGEPIVVWVGDKIQMLQVQEEQPSGTHKMTPVIRSVVQCRQKVQPPPSGIVQYGTKTTTPGTITL